MVVVKKLCVQHTVAAQCVAVCGSVCVWQCVCGSVCVWQCVWQCVAVCGSAVWQHSAVQCGSTVLQCCSVGGFVRMPRMSRAKKTLGLFGRHVMNQVLSLIPPQGSVKALDVTMSSGRVTRFGVHHTGWLADVELRQDTGDPGSYLDMYHVKDNTWLWWIGITNVDNLDVNNCKCW